MPTTSSASQEMFKTVRKFVHDHTDSAIRPYQAIMDAWGQERIESPATHLPVLAHLASTVERTAPDTHALTQALVRSAGALHWRQSFTSGDVGDAFLQSYGWTDVIGKYGPLVSSVLRAGFVIWAPGTYYPPHKHMAEEIYVVLSGSGEFRKGTEEWTQRKPGAVIRHRTMVLHANRTAADPVLVFYLWRNTGDMAEKPTFEPFPEI